MRKTVCFECQKWSMNSDICEHCGNIISRELKKEIQEKEEQKNRPIEPPQKPYLIQRFMDYLRKSRNPLFNLIYYVIMSVWLLYVGIMLLFMYIIAIATS